MNIEARKQQLIEDFKKCSSHLSPEAISNTIESLSKMDKKTLEAATAYPATGKIAGLLFYSTFEITVIGGETFTAKCWSGSFPGGGALFGDVYLNGANTLDDLYANTTNYTMTMTPVYTAVYFYDKNQAYLGSFQAGSVSTITGSCSGQGTWS